MGLENPLHRVSLAHVMHGVIGQAGGGKGRWRGSICLHNIQENNEVTINTIALVLFRVSLLTALQSHWKTLGGKKTPIS